MMEKKARSRSLPPDILFYNILPRLPAKSVLRFKCVSKEWQSSLTTPWFEKLHIHHAIATNHEHQNNLKLLIFSRETRHTFNNCEALDRDRRTARQPFPFKADSQNMNILASFGGLVCVGLYYSYNYIYNDMILWNPLTGDYKTLSKVNAHKNCYNLFNQRASGLYYSSCDDDFKLLCVTHNLNAYIYSLKSDAWRRADSTNNLKPIAAAAYQHPDCCLWPSIALNENLYFLKHGQDSTRSSIIRFNTKTEKFIEIATPCFHSFTEMTKKRTEVFSSFIVLRGRIHFFVIYFTKSDLEWQHVECWWMDEDGKWIKEVSLPKASYIIIEPLHVVKKGKQILNSTSDGRAWKLDFTRHVIKDISWSFTPDCLHIPRRGKYIETLVSPNRYMM